MRSGLILIYDNIGIILLISVISIVFFIWFEKNNKKEEFYSQKEVNKKNLYLNRIDIIGNKVGTIILIGILILGGILYSIFS